jgi:hypothetical protein
MPERASTLRRRIEVDHRIAAASVFLTALKEVEPNAAAVIA